MAIKPILFNTEMVRAILDRRKSCTRRSVKPQWEECPHCKYVHKEYIYDKLAENVYCARCGYPLVPERRTPYQPGDILYVRETWKKALNGYYYYESWQRNEIADITKWKPSIHMPKEAARIWLKVTDVRVERLQDITPQQAENEGVGNLFYEDIGYSEKNYGTEVDPEYGIAKEQFAWLWESTIKKSYIDRYGWNANPWVWVIEFEQCEKPKGEN
nr:MAG TPA: ASCH domain protein [Caudoviricetes sp.]